jgi:hypothetical protein
MRLVSAVALGIPAGCLLVACGGGTPTSEPDDPGITCSDGYVAHPDYGRDENGCGPHGGVVDPMMDALDAYLDNHPDGPPSHYTCRDGWSSAAVYRQGACSHHGGVGRLVWPDGTQVTLYGPGAPAIIKPDGSVVRFDP